MNKGNRVLSMLLCFLFLSIYSFAQNVTLSGTVRNTTTSDPVPAVSVVVKGSTQGTFTNADGGFSISVSKLPVTLVFSSIGYDEFELNVTSASTSIEVSFRPNSQLGQEVVVAATRTPTRILESPVTVERMSSTTLRNVPAPNYYEAIANLKGVDMHTASLTFRTVTTRGFVSSGNTRLNQLVDGMDNQAPGLNFSVGSVAGLTELDVDNVELLAGASSALYGAGGINGTLLINSKNPFRYQGFSYNIKQGIMHIDSKQRSPAPYYDWNFRYAKAWKDKFAFKISAALTKGSDWQADDYRNKQQLGVLSAVVPGNRSTDPNYNGVNVYGDEASANMQQFAQAFRSGVQTNPLSAAFANAASGGATTSITAVANGALGNNPSQAMLAGFVGNVNTFLGSPQVQAITTAQQRADYLAAIQGFLPVNLGLNNGTIPSTSASRTGYNERDLVDYNTLNVKFNAGFHYKITPNIEASLNTYFGTGTTVYTGADRYSLRNLKIAQHKLEFRGKTWYVRGYTTQENSGESYNASALGSFINSTWKSNQTWFAQYVATYSEARRTAGATDPAAHAAARSVADVGRFLPGTPAYQAALTTVRKTPISKGGAQFLDKTDLYAGDAQLNFSDAIGFSDKIEVIAGAQWKQYVLNSQGTIFADTLDKIKINETGGYIQLRKKLFNDVLTLTASGRYDKQTNFDGRFTPRFTGVVRIAKDNNLRLSYQTAYRFPTNQDQYISLVTAAGTLIGALPEFQTYYGLNSTTRPGYTAASILRYRATGNANDLVVAQFKELKPETVKSYEFGYKGILGRKLLLDGYVYYSIYKDFNATIGVGQSNIPGSPTGLLSALTTTNVSYKQNAPNDVKAIGWGISADFDAGKGYFVYGNVFNDQLRDLEPGLVSFFNAPKYRYNIGFRNENIYKGFGFNIVVKHQSENYYEGTFVTGTLPQFTWLDGQVSYRPVATKSVFRIGATNIGNMYRRTGFGSPAVGGLYYFSYGYNLF